MSKNILIYTDYPKYGIQVWNEAACRNLEAQYKLTFSWSDKDRRNFVSLLEHVTPDLIIFSDKSPESNKLEKTKAILVGIPYVSVAHLVPEQYKEVCNDKAWVECALKGAEEVIAVSQNTLKSLQDLGLPKDKGVVIYPCFDKEFNTNRYKTSDPFYAREVLQIPKTARVFLTVARTDRTKGYHLQLDVIHKLREKEKNFNNLHWIWVGDGTDYYQLYSILQDTGLNTNIHMIEQMVREVMPDIYASADAFILPSFYEGTPIALLEAMAMGLPIAATTVDGVNEVLTDDNAFLMTNPNKDANLTKRDLEFAYDLFSNENAITKKFRENILHEREKYTEEIFAKNLTSVVENVWKNSVS